MNLVAAKEPVDDLERTQLLLAILLRVFKHLQKLVSGHFEFIHYITHETWTAGANRMVTALPSGCFMKT